MIDVGYLLTICARAADVLALNAVSPGYFALMLPDPVGSVDVVKVAFPPLRAAVPRAVAPLLNVISSPSGGVPPAEVTVAVNLTGWPMKDGFSEETTVDVVENFATTDWLKTADVFEVLLPSPEY